MPQPWISAEELSTSDVELARDAVASASFLLWAMSGRKYGGIQTVTETYECPCSCGPVGASSRTVQAGLDGRGNVVNRQLGCTPTSHRLRLRGRPILAVHTVEKGGVALNVSDYTVVGRHTLIISSTDPCDVTVTYTYGSQVPVAGRLAARKLADEFVKGWNQDEECRLPDRVTSVSRQGVSYTILDNQDFLAELRTGIYEVDLFLKVANPDNARKPARVLTPDMPRIKAAKVANSRPPKPASDFDIAIRVGSPALWTVYLNEASSEIDWTAWDPYGQFVDVYGNPVLEIDSTHFTYDEEHNTFVVSLSAAETGTLMLVGGETWDLYARNDDTGNNTLIYVLSGNIRRLS